MRIKLRSGTIEPWSEKKEAYLSLWGFYDVSAVFQLFIGDSSQIHVSWTIFNHSIILTLEGQP